MGRLTPLPPAPATVGLVTFALPRVLVTLETLRGAGTGCTCEAGEDTCWYPCQPCMDLHRLDGDPDFCLCTYCAERRGGDPPAWTAFTGGAPCP